MSAVDAGAVNTIVPVLRRALGANVALIEWVVTSYLLVVSGLLLTLGRLGDLRGHRALYVSGFAVFVVASAACGLAPNAATLIAFRAVQGAGAATLFANSTAILTLNFRPEERGRVLGLRATATYLGLTAGPFLGGWLAGTFGWRAVFFINAPIGFLAIGVSWRFIPRDAPAARESRFDLAGAATWILGLTALLLAVNQGHAWGWTSVQSLALVALACLFLAGFVVIERRANSPMLALDLFRNRTFAAASSASMLHYVCVYTIVFLLPFYLIQGRGFGPAETGLLLTVQSVLRAAAAPASGTLSDRIGPRPLAILGMATLGVGLLALSRLGPSSPLGQVALALGIAGLGAGIFISPNNSALMGSAPLERQGTAAGVLATARNVGMALGVGLAGAILSARANLPAPSEALFGAVRTGFRAAACVAMLGALTSAAEVRVSHHAAR